MKNGAKQRPGIWQVWKDALAAWATIAILIAVIASIFGIAPIDLDSLYQVRSYFLLAVFVPVGLAYLLLDKTSQCTESHRRMLGYILATLALISLIAWLTLGETLRQQSIWAWALCSLIPFAFFPSAISLLSHKQLRQPEETQSKAKEMEEAPSTPKHEGAKIIGFVALFVILLATVLTRKRRKL